MASHAQIDKNLNDVNDAWGTFQSFVSYVLPTHAKIIDNLALAVRRNKRKF